MDDKALKIGVFADIERAKKSFNEITAQWKELRKELNSTKAGTVDYNIAETEFLKVANQRAEWQKRFRTEIGKTRDQYFELGTELRRQTIPLMTSFSQVIQDIPYGVRGIGNNIEFLTQQFTGLIARGARVGDVLKAAFSTIVGPTGILLGVSIVTSLATVLSDKLAPSTEKVKEQQKKLNEEIKKEKDLRDDILRLQYELGNVSEREYVETIRKQIEVLKKKRDELVAIWFLENRQFVPPTTKLNTPGFSTAAAVSTGVNISVSDADKEAMKSRRIQSLELEKQILDLQKLLDGIFSRRDKTNLSGIGAYAPEGMGVITQIKSIDDFLEYKKKHPTSLVALPDGTIKMAYEITFAEFARYGKVAGVKTKEYNYDLQSETYKSSQDDMQKNLETAKNMYNSVFFSPIKNGITELVLGSKKFGDAMVAQIKRMGAELLVSGLFSLVFSLLGGGSFWSIFKGVNGLSPVPQSVATTQSISTLNDGLAVGSSASPMRIIGDTTIRGSDIVVSYRRANAQKILVNQ